MQAIAWISLLMLVSYSYTLAKTRPTTTCYQPEIQCGHKLCCCDGTLARCADLKNNLTYIPELDKNITTLIFRGNKLSKVSRASLQNASKIQLTSLDLSDNGIERLDQDTFVDFKTLIKLDLSHNREVNKTDMSISLGSLQKYKYFKLILEDVGISELPTSFFLPMNGSRTNHLSLSNNHLKSANMSVFHPLPFLQHLSLADNSIEELDAAPGHQGLEILDLRSNEITRDTPVFCKRKYKSPYPLLNKLDLSKNYISELKEPSWRCLETLKTLYLGSNVLRSIPNNAFSRLPNLTELDINSMINSNMKLRRYALNSSSLQTLKINGNNMFFKRKDLVNNYFKYCPNLITMDISNNHFKALNDTEIASFLSPLTKLQSLTMVHCHLHEVPPNLFVFMKDLRYLNFDGNRLTTLDGLFNDAHALEHFSAEGNRIKFIGQTTFPKHVLQTLKHIDIANNYFECSCNLLWFRTAVGNGVFPGTNFTLSNWPWSYRCRSPANLDRKLLTRYNPTEESCRESHLVLILSSVLGSTLLLTLIAVPVTYRYRWYIMYWRYRWRHDVAAPERSPLLKDHVPYIYVIYHDEDRHLIHNDFRKLFEEEYGQRLYIWHRDSEFGAKAEVMFDGIHGSKHVIAVVSKHFMADDWCEFQLDVATNRQIELKKDFLTLVILEDVNKAIVRRSWCLTLTRLTSLDWCSDTNDIRRKLFEQHMKAKLSNKSI